MNSQNETPNRVKQIVLQGLQGHKARVYLFGSWAKGKQRQSSDVDVAILPLEPLPRGLLSEIREALEESTIPYSVELVDLSQTDSSFQDKVIQEGLLWNG